MQAFIEENRKTLPCRDTQLQQLYELYGERDEPLPYSLFVSGSTATGKTACLNTIMNYLGYKHVFVNCIECYTPKIMFESILNSLNSEEEVTKCDNLMEFVNRLNNIKTTFKYEPLIIIIDKAERLRNTDNTILPALLRLREFCSLNVSTIFITDLLYENFNFKIGLREPIKLYFPNYTRDELFKIIFLSHKSFVNYIINHNNVSEKLISELYLSELFGNYLNAFLSVFYRPCRDLIELRHMARINFMKYVDPIVNGSIKADDLSKLWRHISPLLKISLETLYLRLNTSVVTLTSSPGKENDDPYTINTFKESNNIEKILAEELTSTKIFAQSFELPYYAKYLLIAAYLASYNPPKEDKRLFVKNHGKQRKRLQQIRAKAKINEKLNTQLGPKVFTLDRLLAIFYAILEEKVGLTSNLLSQISSLVELRLLSSSGELELDNAKYKCTVGYDFIAAIAQTVGFNVRKYLYDFM